MQSSVIQSCQKPFFFLQGSFEYLDPSLFIIWSGTGLLLDLKSNNKHNLSDRMDSNHQTPTPKADALPIVLLSGTSPELNIIEETDSSPACTRVQNNLR